MQYCKQMRHDTTSSFLEFSLILRVPTTQLFPKPFICLIDYNSITKPATEISMTDRVNKLDEDG